MKMKCIVCGKLHRFAGLFCEEHRNLSSEMKKRWITRYNNAVRDDSFFNKEDYALCLMIPKKNEEGEFTDIKPNIILNGEYFKLIPPLVITLDKNSNVDMRMLF